MATTSSTPKSFTRTVIFLALFAGFFGAPRNAFAIAGCPNWNGASWTPGSASMTINNCAIACGGTGQARDPWDAVQCDATCHAVSCIVSGTCDPSDPTCSALCPCPPYLGANWALMDANQQASCCGSPPPPPPPPPLGADCTTVPTAPADFTAHGCGTAVSLGTPQCADSEMPVPPPPAGTLFSSLANPMSVCCGRGWGENIGSARKMDCVESFVPQAPAVFVPFAFYNFYMAGGAPDPVTTAGLKYPNQMFVLDKTGTPLNGFYDQSGKRCNYRDKTTKLSVKLTVAQQMKIFMDSLASQNIPSGLTANAEVDPYCCNMVIFALERKCPVNDDIGGVPVKRDVAGTRRCTAAKTMKLDYAIYDFCDPTVVKRSRFRMATSYTGEDPTRASVLPIPPIDVLSLITEFYPSPIPTLPPTCPNSPAIYTVPWTAGLCRLLPIEPLF